MHSEGPVNLHDLTGWQDNFAKGNNIMQMKRTRPFSAKTCVFNVKGQLYNGTIFLKYSHKYLHICRTCQSASPAWEHDEAYDVSKETIVVVPGSDCWSRGSRVIFLLITIIDYSMNINHRYWHITQISWMEDDLTSCIV